MSDQRQNHQYLLAFLCDEGSEASGKVAEGTDTLRAERGTESPARNSSTCRTAVYANRTYGGVGGGTGDRSPYPDQNWLPHRRRQNIVRLRRI
jgi:hypothetical protein